MATPMPMYGRKYQKGVNWITAIAMTGFHIGAVAALFYIDLGAILTAVVLWIVAGMLGIGMGYHRLLTHRGYKTPELGRILPDAVRHARARGRPDLLGGHAPHPPPEVRSRRRPAHAARGHLVGAHGLDSARRRAAPRCVDPGPLRPRPVARSVSPLALELALVVERRRRPRRCWRSAASRTCCGASSSAPPGASTRRGW